MQTALTIAPADSLSFPRSFGDYELLEEIARGGMGIVYRARQKSLDRIVAVKLLLVGQYASEEFIHRFRIEASAAASLQHPNIVAIHEVGVHQGQHYFAMDFVDGPDLAHLVRDQPLPAKRAAGYVKTIAEAIHFAHTRRILHRDLKPSNVLIDSNDQPRVTDFGLAKNLANDSELTLSGQVMGSPSFMPPEQALGERVKMGPASDVYSLGAILYHALTGRPPFVGETLNATLQQVESKEPVAPRLLVPGVPIDLETICLKCLEKEPQRRYGSAKTLADDLEHWLRHEPITARRATTRERIGKWVRRNPSVAALTVATVLALLLGFIGITWQWRRAETKAVESRDRLARFQVANGLRLQAAGDLFGSLPCLAEALVLDEAKSEAVTIHRLRLAVAIRQTPKLVNFWAHPGGLTYARFSPDAKRVFIVGDENGEGRIWDVESHRPLTPLFGGSNPVFSADGQRLLIFSFEGTVRVWDATTGQPVTSPVAHNLSSFSRDYFTAAFSRERRYVAVRYKTGSRKWADSEVLIFDAVTGAAPFPPLKHDHIVTHASFSPDDERLLTTSQDHTARLWNMATGKEALRITNHQGSVAFAEFSPDGHRFVTASDDGKAWVWDTATGKSLTPPLQHFEGVAVARFSPDQRFIATTSGGRIQLWDAHSGKPVHATFDLQGSSRADVLFSPDGRWFAASGANTVQVWDALSGHPVTPELFHDQRVESSAFSLEGDRLLTASSDGKVRVWDLTKLALANTPLSSTEMIRDAEWSPDGVRLVTAAREGTARIWDVESRRVIGPLMTHSNPVELARFSPDGGRVLTVTSDSKTGDLEICIREAVSGRVLVEPIRHKAGGWPLRTAVFDSEGRRVLTAFDRTAQVWDAATGRPISPALPHPDRIWDAAFNPRGDEVVTSCRDGAARIWNARSGTQIRELRHKSFVTHVAFSPDGRLVATSSSDQTAQIWRASTGGRVGRAMGHSHFINWVSFSPDGKRVVTTSHDQTARVWDTATGFPNLKQAQPSDESIRTRLARANERMNK